MGCGCGGSKTTPVPVAEDAPNPNTAEENDAWWQANPPLPPTAAVPMPS
jgi:hypothetical protein